MADIPESTYYFPAEFEPSTLIICLGYILLIGIAACVFMLILEKESVDGEYFFGGSAPRKQGREIDTSVAVVEVEDRGSQSPNIWVSEETLRGSDVSG